MKKWWVCVCVLFVALPLLAQGTSTADQSNCLVFPKGDKVCLTNGTLIVRGNLEVRGNLSSAGTAILGGDNATGGVVIGNGGVLVRGNLGIMPRGSMFPLFPQYAENGFYWQYSEKDVTASDRFSVTEKPTTRISVTCGSYANLDPVTGGYEVFLTSREPGKGVEVVEATQDYFVVRSLSADPVRFGYALKAVAKGHTKRPRFTPEPHSSIPVGAFRFDGGQEFPQQ